MKIAIDEIGQFLGGLLAVQVAARARELGEGMTEDQWKAQRGRLLSLAYDEVVEVFPEPMRSKLRADRDSFLATTMGLN